MRRNASIGIPKADAAAGDVHRLAVLDRLYYGDASTRHLETLHLLDASVRWLFAVLSGAGGWVPRVLRPLLTVGSPMSISLT